MDNNGKLQICSYSELILKGEFLCGSVCMVIKVIQSDLANGDNSRIGSARNNPLRESRRPFGGLMGVNSLSPPDLGGFLS